MASDDLSRQNNKILLNKNSKYWSANRAAESLNKKKYKAKYIKV